jgi:hypothetical protein
MTDQHVFLIFVIGFILGLWFLPLKFWLVLLTIGLCLACLPLGLLVAIGMIFYNLKTRIV